jgi:glutamate synthase (NADPH) large chain
MYVTGDVNDYFGKGLSGGKLIVTAPIQGVAEENVIAGNVALYGATSGTAFINGRAGERFAVRNSGVDVVVEGIGDHGCEYMTGGRAVILGDVGKNFGAGMSGGIAYVLVDDLDGFKQKCNTEMIGFERIELSEERHAIRQLIMDHYYYTKSTKAMNILDKWEKNVQRFVKVVPNDYKKMLDKITDFKRDGLTDDAAAMQAFLATSVNKEIKPLALVKK